MDLILFSETTNIDGSSFVASPQALNPKFLADAQQAIKYLQESPLFKDASLAELTPQYTLSISIE